MKPPRVVLDTPSALVVAADLGAGGPFESGHRQRGAEVGSVGARSLASDDAGGWSRMRELFPWLWSDPLSFIGRAANEGA